jgi:hypothetical protein
LVGQDPYPPEQIARWFELVRSTVATAPNVRAVYMPVFEQTAVARANQDFLLERGIEVDTPARWLRGDICYAPGWALGGLKYIPPRITGLTTEPITLRGYNSQSFGAGHHNFVEESGFEPRLEPGLPPQQLAELESANIRLQYVIWDYLGNSAMFILGFGGQVRPME